MLKKYLLIALGSISLGLGFVGILFPVLPTTPFVLIALYCYLRSSRKLYDWLMCNKLFGKYLYNYVEHRAVPLQTKIVSLSVLWAALITSAVLVDLLFVRIILACVGIAVSIHLLTLRTITTAQMKTPGSISAESSARESE